MFPVCSSIATPLRVIIVEKSSVRFVSFYKLKEAVKGWFGASSGKLPYKHACQIGDPVLRSKALTVNPDIIKSAEFQKMIKHLIRVMRGYEGYGLAAPQIGLPWQLFVMEITNQYVRSTGEALVKTREIQIVPLRVFVNPQLRVTDHTPVAFHEMCESVRGFSAVVPRAYEVEVTALNASGEQFTWKAHGWPARIAQHEYDHLQGKLYVDRMDISTLHCPAWNKINKYAGRVHLQYWPKRY